jgi:hypothetical protein
MVEFLVESGLVPREVVGAYIRTCYWYFWRGRFTNHKHRRVEGVIKLDEDAPFLAYTLEAWVGTESCLVQVGIPDYAGSRLITLSPGEPFCIFPELCLDPGFSLRVIAELVGNVGRKRPKFQVTIRGVKLYKEDK